MCQNRKSLNQSVIDRMTRLAWGYGVNDRQCCIVCILKLVCQKVVNVSMSCELNIYLQCISVFNTVI